jgi:hypothetical protein
MTLRAHCLSLLMALAAAAPCQAFGPQGHEAIGAIADKLLKPHAAAQVAKALGMPLRTAATWADCVKDVNPVAGKGLVYTPDPRYHAACQAFETTAGIARMQDYVRRNWQGCSTDPHVRACHKKYHFADVAIQHDYYDRAYAGTSDHDIVSAVVAAIGVLQGRPSPAPIAIKDRKEALLLLAHLVGDLHQPLHVGAVYLDGQNQPTDPGPATAPIDRATDTHGGNDIEDRSSNLHAQWDDVPSTIKPLALPAPLLAAARAAPATPGALTDWPATWAGATVVAAQQAFGGLQFTRSGAAKPGDWVATIADRPGYAARRAELQRAQVALAGAHLAALLNAVWP